jgi:hypothetical protein
MKAIKFFGIFIISIFLISSYSCKKDSGGIHTPTISANIGGSAWSGVATGLSASGKIVITGTTISLSGESIALTVNGNTAGTYELNVTTAKAQCAVVYKKSSSAGEGSSGYYIAQAATIVITTIDSDKYASGTFTCTLVHSLTDLTNPLTVTGGTFSDIKISGL